MVRRLLISLLTVTALASTTACSNETSPAAPSAEADVTTALRRADLPEGAFRDRAEELAQEWLDNNIMTGDARLDAGSLEGRLSKSALQTFVKKQAAERLTGSEMPFDDVATESLPFADAVIKDVARVVALDGFVFADNPENTGLIEKDVREVLAFLGDTRTLDVAKVKGTTVDVDNDPERRFAVTAWVFVNRETKAFAWFFAREGTI
jgi:hypothetical protein